MRLKEYPMDQTEINKFVEKAQTKDTLKQVFDLTLEARAERWGEVKPHNRGRFRIRTK